MTPPGISGNLTLVSCDLTCYRPYSSGAPTFGAPPQPKKRLNEETTHIATRHSMCVFVVVVSDHEHKDCIPSETALIWTNNSYQNQSTSLVGGENKFLLRPHSFHDVRKTIQLW